MMPKNFSLFVYPNLILCALFANLLSFLTVNAQIRKQPKLVVEIVVDQMRYDYLSKYWDKYTDGGFKRLVNEGYVMANTHYDYAPTYTGVGHATIVTGTSPAIHGIAGNDWYSRELKRNVYCVEDNKVNTLGSKTNAGKFSPRNLKANTISDQLKITSPNSKVIGISLKDRGAILSAGHLADAAYWFDAENGYFISSTYYLEKLPGWVNGFNKKGLVKKYLSTPWNTLHPIETYTESTADDMPFEGRFKGETHSAFPHNLPLLAKEAGLGLIRQTPFGNSFTLDMAKEAIVNEALGKDEFTDFLAVSLSSPDYIGHMYGPHSIEVEDNYLRLDQDLADFINFLETNAGEGNFIIFLTSDHGAADIPAYVKGNTDYLDVPEMSKALRASLTGKFGVDLVEAVINDQIYLDHDRIKDNKMNEQEVRQHVRDELLKFKGIIGVVDPKDGVCRTDVSICDKIKSGNHPSRSGDISFIKEAGWLDDYNIKSGTTHGSPFPYDTHIPLVWYGMEIKPGVLFREVHVRDIAPTLSFILGIPMPNGATGTPVYEFLDDVLGK